MLQHRRRHFFCHAPAPIFKTPEVFDTIRRGRRLKNADHVPGSVLCVSSTANDDGVDIASRRRRGRACSAITSALLTAEASTLRFTSRSRCSERRSRGSRPARRSTKRAVSPAWLSARRSREGRSRIAGKTGRKAARTGGRPLRPFGRSRGRRLGSRLAGPANMEMPWTFEDALDSSFPPSPRAPVLGERPGLDIVGSFCGLGVLAVSPPQFVLAAPVSRCATISAREIGGEQRRAL